MDKLDRNDQAQISRTFNCKFCSKCFTLRQNCSRHEKRCENNKDRTMNSYVCPNCSMNCNRSDNLKLHMTTCKNTETNGAKDTPMKKSKTPCLVRDCKQEFFHKTRLIEHLKMTHRDEVQIKDTIKLEFKSHEDFLKWKEEEEENTFSYFSQKNGHNETTSIFYCQHDGSAHSKRKTSRCNLKGKIKVGHHCIAMIRVEKKSDSLFQVDYHPTHSHRLSPQDYLHHPLPKQLSDYVDQQIAEQVSPTKIFEKVKNMYTPKNTKDLKTEKMNIVTKKMIRERARKKRITERFHEDDAKSVFIMANDMATNEESVLIYKPYGGTVVFGPEEINHLPYANELFMFGFQTSRQLQLMKEHCDKILIIDETHGTNQYLYKLLTCMIVDENRRGWSVGHLITNRSDAATLKFFFKAVSSRIDDVSKINCVITDDDSAIINGVEDGLSSSVRHILCRWHVIKNLRENLRSKVSKDLFEEMFDEVRVIMNEKDQKLFEDLCKGFTSKYDKEEKATKFVSYFKQYYLNRPEKWAMCFRNFPHAEVNTTGHIESFHNKFKKMYMKRKVNKRLDDLIVMLRNLEWEDYCTRQRDALMGFSPIPQHIGERHHKSLNIPDTSVKEILTNTWEIKSQSKTASDSYVIVRYGTICTSDYCFLKCTRPQCDGLCSHLYTCSCPDQHPLCKHIHKLHAFLYRGQPSSSSDFYLSLGQIGEEQPEQKNGVEETPTTTNNVSRKHETILASLQENINSILHFQSLAQKNEVSDITLKHVNSLLSNVVHHIHISTGSKKLENVNEIKPEVKFSSREKLKTQLSQLSSFKRPIGKRKRKQETDCAQKRTAVVRNLLDFVPLKSQNTNCEEFDDSD